MAGQFRFGKSPDISKLGFGVGQITIAWIVEDWTGKRWRGDQHQWKNIFKHPASFLLGVRHSNQNAGGQMLNVIGSSRMPTRNVAILSSTNVSEKSVFSSEPLGP